MRRRRNWPRFTRLLVLGRYCCRCGAEFLFDSSLKSVSISFFSTKSIITIEVTMLLARW